ncbi:hypothetical protein JW968_04255 [Candidatus Woesearchaeota archaeon]|nr:hypothetical protein [Candidatus Woesearchaeota archaeon]
MSEDTLDAFVWFLGAVRTVPDWYGCPEALMYLSRRDGSQAHVRMLFRGIDFHGICLDKGDAQEGVFINRTELPDFVTRKLIYIFSDPQDNSLEIRMLVN